MATCYFCCQNREFRIKNTWVGEAPSLTDYSHVCVGNADIDAVCFSTSDCGSEHPEFRATLFVTAQTIGVLNVGQVVTGVPAGCIPDPEMRQDPANLRTIVKPT